MDAEKSGFFRTTEYTKREKAMDFTMIVNGVPLVLVVLGLVEWLKRVGVTGRASLAASLVIGLVLGVGYQVSTAMPAGFGEWFAAVVFGLALGLVASGIYDATRKP